MLPGLSDPSLFLAALQSVAERQRAVGDEEPLLPGLPRLNDLTDELPQLATRLARRVSCGEYELAPLVPRLARFEGKERVLYHALPLDKVVLTAIASALGVLLEPTFSPHLYSYRRGFSPVRAVHALGSYLRAHRADRPDPRTRGLYVVRRDVKAYGDSIPSGPAAPLWELLRARLPRAAVTPTAYAWLVRHVAPRIAQSPLVEGRAELGIPTGSPLQPLIGNVYLGELDRCLGDVPGGFYARFGDDIVFAHAERAVAERAAHELDRQIRLLGLVWSHDKCEQVYLNGAGRAEPTRGGQHSSFRGTSHLRYLGVRIDGAGCIGLSTDKAARLLRNLSRRLEQGARLCTDAPPEVRARTLCGIANAALDPRHPTAERSATLLASAVNDHRQLKDLDYRIALAVAERVSGCRGVRAFRTMPIQVLRRQHGLSSLVVRRCLRERRARAA